jgi:hypothetical protein
VISSLEISLQQVRKTLQDTEYENVQLRHRIEDLTEDQRKLMTLNASLETKMEIDKKLVKKLRYKTNERLFFPCILSDWNQLVQSMVFSHSVGTIQAAVASIK